MNSTQQDTPHHIPILVLLHYLPNRLSILLPHLLSYKRRVRQHKVEIVVILLGNQVRSVEVILKIVRVVIGKLDVVLGNVGVTSKRKRGF